MQLNFENKWLQWAALLLLAFVWGSSFILMKKGLIVYNYTQLATLRMGIAFISLLPFSIYFFKHLNKKNWVYILMVGLFGNGIPAYLFTKAQTNLSSSLTGMLNSMVPLFTLIVGVIIFKNSPSKNKIIGVLIGLIGAAGIIGFNGIDLSNGSFYYSFYVIAATICYAISVNIIKFKLQEINPVAITSLAFLFIGIPITAYALIDGSILETTKIHKDSISALSYIIILAVFGTGYAVLLFNFLIKKSSAIFAASVTYIIPFVALMWGLVDGETINFIQLISLVIIITGIYIVNKN
ncbi:MAG: DMT family transporter [Vicingaceae bacterium]